MFDTFAICCVLFVVWCYLFVLLVWLLDCGLYVVNGLGLMGLGWWYLYGWVYLGCLAYCLFYVSFVFGVCVYNRVGLVVWCTLTDCACG